MSTRINLARVRTFDELREEIARFDPYCKLKIYDSETRTHEYYYTYLK